MENCYCLELDDTALKHSRNAKTKATMSCWDVQTNAYLMKSVTDEETGITKVERLIRLHCGINDAMLKHWFMQKLL